MKEEKGEALRRGVFPGIVNVVNVRTVFSPEGDINDSSDSLQKTHRRRSTNVQRSPSLLVLSLFLLPLPSIFVTFLLFLPSFRHFSALFLSFLLVLSLS